MLIQKYIIYYTLNVCSTQMNTIHCTMSQKFKVYQLYILSIMCASNQPMCGSLAYVTTNIHGLPKPNELVIAMSIFVLKSSHESRP